MSIASENNVTNSSSEPDTKCACSSFKTFVNQLKSRKTMGQLQQEIDTQNPLQRTLNWVQLTGIGLGAIIGAGIFVLSGNAAAKYAGPSVILSFVISGIVAVLAALSFSELSTMMSHSGAAYTFTYAALGEYLAWFIGWNYALFYQLAALTVIVAWSKYVVHLAFLISGQNTTALIVEAPVAWNETGMYFYTTGQVLNLPAIAITIAITLLLIAGVRLTAIVNLILTVFKIIVLLIFILICAKYVNNDNYTPFIPENQGSFSQYGFSGMLHACTYIFFAYNGFDSIATIAQEAKTPMAISIPFATIASIVISLLIYLGICTVMVGLVPYKLLESNNPLSETIKVTPYGLWLLILIDLGAIAGLTTVALTVLLSQTRVFYAMASDGLLPKFFARISSRTKTPWISIVISGVFCAIMSGVFPVDILGGTASISALITYLFVHVEVIVMRYTHRDMPRVFRVPFGSWFLPIVGSLLCILLMINTSKATAYRFLVWTAIGQIIYFCYGFRHSIGRPSAAQQEHANSPEEVRYSMKDVAINRRSVKVQPDVIEVISNAPDDEIIVMYL